MPCQKAIGLSDFGVTAMMKAHIMRFGGEIRPKQTKFVSHHSLMRKQSGNVFKEQIRCPLCFSQTGHFKEESASGIFESSSPASLRKCLAGETSAQEVEVREFSGINGSCIGIETFLLSDVVDGTIAGIGMGVNLAVSDTPETACPVKSCPKAADAGKHVKIGDQNTSSPC